MFSLFLAILIHLATASGAFHTPAVAHTVVRAPAVHADDSSGGPMPTVTAGPDDSSGGPMP